MKVPCICDDYSNYSQIIIIFSHHFQTFLNLKTPPCPTQPWILNPEPDQGPWTYFNLVPFNFKPLNLKP